MHIDAVEEEVDKLLEAKAIREVNYLSWLSNTVVVKKKNGKWRVLVDFVAEFTPSAILRRTLVRYNLGYPGEQEETQLGPKNPTLAKQMKEEKPKPCGMYIGDSFHLFVNGCSNRQGVGAGVVLVSPDRQMIEQSRLEFKASNNEAEYEALIVGLKLAAAMEADDVVVFCDSQLIVNQVVGEYAAQDELMIAYIKEVVRLLSLF
ncbi:uncharacterized protein LOC114273173 [Camellia sinensis]|uniref:uncharacterized protein LOC114273173 n=1 Tax=Camellia sinensis TaxID=4442 RepID=UPI0010358511|nr:uncharacterized protein LOC114273173 [Camellia sinensis]